MEVKVKSRESIEKIHCPKCHKLMECIGGKCEFCGTDAISKYKNNIIIFFVIAGISLGLYNLTIDLLAKADLLGMSVIFGLGFALGVIGGIAQYLVLKEDENIITSNTIIKSQETTMKRAQEIIKSAKGKIEDNATIQTILKENNELTEKVKDEIEKAKKKRQKKEKEIESKKIKQTILEEKNKAYEKDKKKIVEKYTKKILGNSEILCLYYKILDNGYKSAESLRKDSKKIFKILLWDFVLGDIKIKDDGIKTHGTFDLYKSKYILNNIDELNVDTLKIEISTKYNKDYIQVNKYLTTNNVAELSSEYEGYRFSAKCRPIFVYTCLFVNMMKANEKLIEFENNEELFTIYNNMYEAKITDESIVNKMYTLYTNLYTKSFKGKLEETDWCTIIELAKRKKLAEKYNIDSDVVIETKEQLIDYIVANLIDFNREGQIIGIANILNKQEKMKTSLKFDIITNIDDILNDASARMIKIKEEKELEELKAERDRLLKGDLSKEKNREELELSLDNIKTGYDFENYVATLYKRLGYTIEKVTKKSGDQGADVIAIKDNYRYVIQAKYYSSHVGNAAVQEIVAAIAMYKANKGIVITNNAFTQSAKELAKANNIELVDGKKIEEYKKQILGRYQIKVKI